MERQTVQKDLTGVSLLKLTGSLMLIFGILGVLLYAGFTAVLIAANHITGGVFSGGKDIFGMSLLLAAALAELIGGVIGRKAAQVPAKAGKCFFWGAAVIVLTLAGILHILLRMQSATRWEAILAAVLGIVTPLVYLIGAARVRRAARTPAQPESEEPADDAEQTAEP